MIDQGCDHRRRVLRDGHGHTGGLRTPEGVCEEAEGDKLYSIY